VPMKIWRVLGGLMVVTCLAVVAGNARADTQTFNFNVSVVDPVNNVSNLIFLYTQGDTVREQVLPGSALAGKTSTFAISEDDVDLTIPGTPSFSIVGLYGPAANQGVYVAVNGPQAATFAAGGTSFAGAFPTFAADVALSAPSTPSEAALVDGLQNPNTVAAENVFLFAEASEGDAIDPFTAINLTGSTKADFLGFSAAALDGSVEVDVVQPGGGTTGVPEPGSGLLVGLTLLAGVVAQAAGKGIGWIGRTHSARNGEAAMASAL
jgi:hypothetical protein